MNNVSNGVSNLNLSIQNSKYLIKVFNQYNIFRNIKMIKKYFINNYLKFKIDLI